MTDIVEMLVDAAGGNEAHVCAIAAAEIKRNLSQIEQLDDRCGRLRDACSTWERASNNYAEAVEIKEAEIEQLRADVVHWREAHRMCLAAGDMMKAEIERLRAADVLMVAEFECQEREITKLVRLLRDGLVGADPRWMTTDAGREWLLRVREALGE